MRSNTKIKLSKKTKKVLRIILIVMICLVVVGAAVVLGVNAYVKASVKDRLLSAQDAAMLEDVDCILVLGCMVHSDGSPSHMLEDRIKRGIELYELEAAPKLLMSGDHGQVNYDEVATMKRIATEAGVPSEDVFMDHAGFSTYESMYRARDIFQAKKIIIVSQEYHLYRAVYIARQLGLDAYGVASDYREYSGQWHRDIREILARNKDFAMCILKPKPTFLGDAIPVSGDGNLTND